MTFISKFDLKFEGLG